MRQEYIDTLLDKIRDLSEINHKLKQENKELKEKLEYIQGITGVLVH